MGTLQVHYNSFSFLVATYYLLRIFQSTCLAIVIHPLSKQFFCSYIVIFKLNTSILKLYKIHS